MFTFGLFSGAGTTHDLVQRAFIVLPLAIVSLTLHEFGHAAAAVALGDPTPRAQGRLSLNPLAHLDPFGTLMMLFGPIGWARPVVVDPRNFKNRASDVFVSLAGPAMNLLLAVVAGLLLRHGHLSNESDLLVPLVTLFSLNMGLAVFNLLPVPPLDGSHIWGAILPRSLMPLYFQFTSWSFVILIGLTMLPGANERLSGLINWVSLTLYHALP